MGHRCADVDPALLSSFSGCKGVPLLLGLCPMRYDSGHLRVSPLGAACTALLAAALAASYAARLLVPRTYLSDRQMVTSYIRYAAVNAAVALHPLLILRRREGLLQVIRIASKVKSFLDVSGNPWKPPKRMLASSVQSFAYVSVVFLNPGMYEDIAYGLSVNAGYICLINAIFWIFALFMWFLDTLSEGFRGLSNRLDKATTVGDVEYLIKCHHCLVKACLRLASSYSVSFSLVFTCFFLVFLSALYKLIVGISDDSPISSVLVLFLIPLIEFVSFFRVVSSSSRVNYEAKRFDRNLYKLLVYKSPPNITQTSSTLKLFFHFSAKTDVTFTLFGFSKLDWNLFYSMMAAACTYLIVVVQLDHMHG